MNANSSENTSSSQLLLYVIVFSSGMTTLAVEFTASRLLGNVFGTSNLVWANVIGLMLLYLAVGYFAGGRLADRFPRPIFLLRLVAWGAFFSGLVPLLARPVLRAAAGAVVGFEAGVAIGSFLAVLVLFAVPVTLLGCVSPFAIRLAVGAAGDVSHAGRISGRMYAVSTLGSLVGTFLPVLWLIPEAGTTATFLIFSAALFVVALAGMATQGLAGRRAALQLIWMPVLLVILAALTQGGPLRAAPANTVLLYEKDSAYNYIQVVEYNTPIGRMVDGQFVLQWQAGTRLLLLNEGQGIHSIWHDEGDFYDGTWDMFLAAPFFYPGTLPADVRSLAVIGLAAGTVSTQYTAVFGEDTRIVGIEIDPDIVAVGRRFFGMTQPNLEVIVEDGRLGLNRVSGTFDVIVIDAYRVPYVPWHLTTREFFEEVQARLDPQRGTAAINVGRTVNLVSGQEDRRLIEAITATMQTVFPTVHTIDVPDSFNTILVGTVTETHPANLTANRLQLPAEASGVLRRALQAASDGLSPTLAGEVVFTDDRAPVETIVNSMLFDFLVGGESQFNQ